MSTMNSSLAKKRTDWHLQTQSTTSAPEKITQALVHFNQLPVPLQSEVATSVS
uniref:Uncharacterized protein n=1 Tax=Anguilla anguilla TaxID=7936 RepID=A0A0E9TV11_ANGAN